MSVSGRERLERRLSRRERDLIWYCECVARARETLTVLRRSQSLGRTLHRDKIHRNYRAMAREWGRMARDTLARLDAAAISEEAVAQMRAADGTDPEPRP